MKSIIASGILLGMAHGSVAAAAPFVNVENNAGFTGSDFNGSVTEVHAGYEFGNGFSLQGGPAFIAVDGGEGSTEYSGKLEYKTVLNESTSLYGEVAFITEDKEFEFDKLDLGTKVGVTFTF